MVAKFKRYLKHTTWYDIIKTPYGLVIGVNILILGGVLANGGPLLPILLSSEIGLSKIELTGFYLLNLFVALFVTLLSGYLSDGFIARHKLIAFCGLLGSAGNFLLFTAHDLTFAYLAGILTAFTSTIFPQLFATARESVLGNWPDEKKGSGIISFRTLFSLGFVLGTLMGSALLVVLNARLIFLLMGFLYVGLTIYSTLVVRQAARADALRGLPLRKGSLKGENKVSGGQRKAFLLPLILPLGVIVLLRGSDSTRNIYLPLIVTQLSHNTSLAPLMFSITAATELIFMSVADHLARRIGERQTIGLGALCGSLYFIILAFTQSLWLIAALQLLYALFVVTFLGVGLAYIQGLVGNRAGLGGSLYINALQVGSVVGFLLPLLVQGYDQKIFIAPSILALVTILLLVADHYFAARLKPE